MLKQAWRSYLAALHPRNIKKVKGSSNAYWILYWLFICPMMVLSSRDDINGNSTLYLIIKMLPFLIMSWSNISSRFLMTKEMYLCPMKREERERYVNYILCFKIGVPAVVGLIIEIIWSVATGFHIFRSIIMVVIYISVGIAIYICLDTLEQTNRRVTWGKIGKDGKIKWAWMNLISFVYGLLIMFAFEDTDLTAQMDALSGVFIGVGLVLIAVFDVLIIRLQYKQIIDQAQNYEYAFNVKGKVENATYNLFAK